MNFCSQLLPPRPGGAVSEGGVGAGASQLPAPLSLSDSPGLTLAVTVPQPRDCRHLHPDPVLQAPGLLLFLRLVDTQLHVSYL